MVKMVVNMAENLNNRVQLSCGTVFSPNALGMLQTGIALILVKTTHMIIVVILDISH